ncbi:dehydrogenase/reductase SDR family member 7-like [Lineus longissimus]|uniref:dehydrogenase/reductase SDR family member 7-like n=1 Tax=Lineus longissimus TaxID=88925 RepID=UPI002B4E710B
MDVILLCVVGLFILTLVLFWLSDADPILLFCDKFGKSPASLAGKVIWITGASSGIGEYLAYELAQNGCKLILSARRPQELERVKKACLGKSSLADGDIMVLPLDVLDFDNHPRQVEVVLKYFKKIDILVNNAGRSQRSEFLQMPLAVHREMLELNVLSVISLTKAVLPHMLERKQGQIVVTSSIAGKIGVPFSATYSATKHALQGLLFALQSELTGTNIAVSIVCPGSVISGIVRNAFTSKPGEAYGIDIPDESMATERCAHLTVVAIANRLLEVWIARQPQLLVCYMFTHFPVVTVRLIQMFGMKRFSKFWKPKAKPPNA